MAISVKKEEAPKKEAPVAKPFINKNPSNWVIVESDKGISAKNSLSGEHFEGSIEDFNKRMK